MQRPPRIKTHKSRRHMCVRSFGPTVVPLTLLLVLAVQSNEAWQYADNQQVFPNRQPDFYHAPAGPAALNQFINSQSVYNQPLNFPLQQQQFLTPASSNAAQQPQLSATSAQVQPVDQPGASEPFSALFAANSRISQPSPASEHHHERSTVPTSDDVVQSRHEQPINARDTSQQTKLIDTTNSQIKSNDHQSSRQDHDIVQSPSPLGKILDVVARETVNALSSSSSISAGKETPPATTKDAKQVASGALAVSEAQVTHATKSESDSSSSSSSSNQPVLHLKPLTQAAQEKKNKNDKSSVNSIEQQIINQHARATSYATLHSRRYEPPTATPAAHGPQQLVRLLPTKHHGDTKLFSNLLSTLAGGGGGGGHNSGNGASGGADLSSRPASGGSPLSSLVDNFKSGISSRSSIVKAAISDNKLARTLSTVGKTIGGNKYVASAGAAAALAALGLTVSKFLSPYVMAGSYAKLGGAGPMEPLISSSSYLYPSYMPSSGDFNPNHDRNFQYLPANLLSAGLGDSMLASPATINQQPHSGQYEEGRLGENTMSQLQSAFNSYRVASQQPLGSSDTLTSSQGAGNFYASYRPTSATSLGTPPNRPTGDKNAFDGGANGHYSSFYSSRPEYEQQNGSGASVDMSGSSGSVGQPEQQHFGSYISGAPTSGEFATGGELTGYSSSSGLENPGSQASGSYQLEPGAGITYEPTGSHQVMVTSNQHYDQFMSSASSDTPTYANNHLLIPNTRVTTTTSPTRTASSDGARAPQHRSGAVMLKLDEATRNLIRQQLQAELAARAAPTNYNYLTMNSARPGQHHHHQHQHQQQRISADQSSGGLTTSLESSPVVSMTDQRAGAADSSGDYATFVQWQPQSSSLKQQRQQQHQGGSATIESNYGAQAAANSRAHLRQLGQFVAVDARVNDNNLPVYNSIGPQMQTRRNEPAASTHVLILPNTMPTPLAPADSSVSSSRPGQQQQQQQQQQHQASAQPRLVPIVGSSSSSASSVTQWSSVGVGQQANQKVGSGGDKKLPAATLSSLESPTSGATLKSGDKIRSEWNSKTSSSLNRSARKTQTASRMSPVQVTERERANNSGAWLVPAVDQQSLIRDYEVLAAQQQAFSSAPLQADRPHEEIRSKSGHSSEQNDELLLLANSMRANLIQLGSGHTATGGRPQPSVSVADGAEYQLDTVEGGGQQEAVAANGGGGGSGGEMENNSFDDKKQDAGGNKLIEARANTNNGAIVVADGGQEPSVQHDKRRRSHSLSMSSQQQQQRRHQQDNQQHRAITTGSGGEGDNVLAELPASVSTPSQRQEQVTPPATTTASTVDQQTLSSGLSQEVVVGGETKHQRAFRGIVAGGLGGTVA